jgi:DMSO/TMAO reductase YedYZ molybdopterin-dependent catalytic subunit
MADDERRDPGMEPPPRQDAGEAAADAGPPDAAPADAAAPAPADDAPRPARPVRPGPLDWLAEPAEVPIERPRGTLASQSRRDFLMLTAGAFATAVGGWWLLPDQTRARLVGMANRDRLDTLAARLGLAGENRERFLDRALTLDDDVAEALYSKQRRVRTYRPAEVTPLRNNYHGRTPGPGYLATWTLHLSGLASGREERLTIEELLARFTHREQITRLVCVEGWSAVVRWGGMRFADVMAAHPPAPGARWAALRSTASLDFHGQPETYYVSIDLPTAEHPQTLLATHKDGRLLPLAHGAPLRLVAPMKLGLKNIKAITDIEYTAAEPPDYWRERGYSAYDGL